MDALFYFYISIISEWYIPDGKWISEDCVLYNIEVVAVIFGDMNFWVMAHIFKWDTNFDAWIFALG